MAKKVYRVGVELELAKARQQAQQFGKMLADLEKRQAAIGAAGARAAAKAGQQSAAAARKQAADLERIEDAYVMRDYRRRVQHAARLEREKDRAARREAAAAERNARRLEAIQDQFIRRDLRMQARWAAARQREQERAAETAGRFEAALLGAGGALLSLSAGKAALGGIVEIMTQARDRSQEMARQVIDTKEALLSLASIAGKDADNAFVLENAIFARKAGMDTGKARSFREAFRGRAQITAGQQIDRGAFGDFEQKAAGLAAARGIDADLAGDLFGGVLKTKNFMGLPQGEQADAAAAEALRVFQVLDASSGDIGVLTRETSQLMGLTSESGMESSIQSAREAAVLAGTMAEFGPGQSSTYVRAAVRGLRDPNAAGFRQAAGIGENENLVDALKKSNTYLEGQVAQGIPVDQALRAGGFKQQEVMDALRVAYNSRDKVFKPLMEAANAPIDPTAVDATIGKHLAGDVGRRAAGRAALEGEQAIVGMKTSGWEARIDEARAKDLAEFGPGGNPRTWLPGMLGVDRERMSAEMRLAEEGGYKPGGFWLNAMSKMDGPAGWLGRGAASAADLWDYTRGNLAGATAEKQGVTVEAPKDLVDQLRRVADGMEKRQPAGGAQAPPPLRAPANPGALNP